MLDPRIKDGSIVRNLPSDLVGTVVDIEEFKSNITEARSKGADWEYLRDLTTEELLTSTNPKLRALGSARE